MKYKAITVTQPYATLIAIGAKDIETRSWDTSHRGPLLVHAGQGLEWVGGVQGLAKICQDEPFRSVLHTAGYTRPDMLPRGEIVAVCELWHIDTTTECLRTITPQEHAFGDYSPGRFGWRLRNVRRLSEPIPARGFQQLWAWEGELSL